MIGLNLVLMIPAIVCFVIAAMGVPVSRVNLVALGPALWAITIVAR